MRPAAALFALVWLGCAAPPLGADAGARVGTSDMGAADAIASSGPDAAVDAAASDASPVADLAPPPVTEDAAAMDAAPTDAALVVDADAPDQAPPDDPCAGEMDGTVVVAGQLSECVSRGEGFCDRRGDQTLTVVACRGGASVEDVQQVECEAEPPDCENGVPTRRPAGLPRVHDLSGADPARVDAMVQAALRGLGLDARTRPTGHDRVFVGRWFMAWIDETGFYGKMNGLWPLNGDPDALEFVLLDDERPVNALVVGEFGQGRWPGGYMGAEHIEFPNHIPEADDDPSCRDTFCAQYSLGEAALYTDPDIPTWRACNAGSPDWADRFEPVEVSLSGTELSLVYEGPLTKQGDFGGSVNGANCHRDFLFPDGVRRRVNLRTGYRLDAESHVIDRLVQVHNPEGNPVFDGPHGFIGGFIMTQWPNPHPLKALNEHLRVDDHAVRIRWNDFHLEVPPGQWYRLPFGVPDHDVVLGWAGQPVTLSPVAGPLLGRAFTLSNHGAQNPDDSGFCLCVVHGGIEMGGGVLHDAIPAGERPLAIRRLTIHHALAEAPQGPWRRVYQAEFDGPLRHNIGRPEDDGWSADTRVDEAGHLIFGPYDRGWPEGPLVAEFRMMLDVVNLREEIVVTVDVFDADTNEVVAAMPIPRAIFRAPFTYQDIRLPFDTRGRAGHAMETRVFWHDISYVRVDRVVVAER